jgi:hypothetical protein
MTMAQIQGLKDVTESTMLATVGSRVIAPWADGKNTFFGSIIGGIGSALAAGIAGIGNTIGSWAASFFESGTVVKDVKDGQESLMSRTDLLEFVRGYCAAFQSVNVNSEWNIFGDNSRWLPYESQLGPSKGAHVEKGKNIVLDEAGLWLVVCYAHVRSTGFDGSNLSAIYVDVVRPDGSLVRSVVVDQTTGGDYGSIPGVFMVVIPEPGCWIRVRAWSGKWRWWDGGARNAWMSAVKFDNRLLNPGQDTVPDEQNPT